MTMFSNCKAVELDPLQPDVQEHEGAARRAAIAAKASSEVPAVRVPLPSSARMPGNEVADIGFVVDDKDVARS